jgi:hypothetical protein
MFYNIRRFMQMRKGKMQAGANRMKARSRWQPCMYQCLFLGERMVSALLAIHDSLANAA